MCSSDIEDTPHFLIKCPSLERTRQPFIDQIKALLNTVDNELYKSIYKNDIRITQLILDVTSPTLPMRYQTDELHIELVMTGVLRIPMSIRPYSNI
jgi:hypothetical protein